VTGKQRVMFLSKCVSFPRGMYALAAESTGIGTYFGTQNVMD
jgi:hypothetical protein